MKKITVTNIKCIESLSKNSELIEGQPDSVYIRILPDCIITYSSSFTLAVISRKKGEVLFRQTIQLKQIKKIVKCKQLLGIICTDQSLFYCCDLRTTRIWACEGHLQPINDLVVFQDYFVTASKDLTIRLWQIIEGNSGKIQKPIKFPIALKGHKGQVNTLCIYHKFLISGSEDKTLICWHNKSIYTTFQLTEPIVKICPLPFSSQLIILGKSSMAHFFGINSLINKKILIKGTLNLQKITNPTHIDQIDESFAAVVCSKGIKFLEVNLIKQIHEISLEKQNEKICDFRCEGRHIFYALNKVGVKLLQI